MFRIAAYKGEITPIDPYNPLGLPANTIRVKFSSGYTPTQGDTQTLVDSTNNVWDIYKSSNNWSSLFDGISSVLEILGANTSNVTRMSAMFYGCTSLTVVQLFDTSSVTTMQSMFYNCRALTSVPLFNTSNVTRIDNMFYYCRALTSVPLFNTSSAAIMSAMFYECTSLTTVPLFDTSSVTDMPSMFVNCTSVESGALALYQQASTQANPPSSHNYCFYNCGSNTVTGAAELAQIPTSWGGTAT